jgi:hypothetical protein
MGQKKLQPWAGAAWDLTRRQHGVVSRRQLLGLGMPPDAIQGRLERGQLHRLWSGVYAVGRPDIGRLGRFKAATLACGPDAQLCRHSAADLWKIRPQLGGPVDVAVPSGVLRKREGIRLHRRASLAPPRLIRGIPVGDPVSVLVDLATDLPVEEMEDAVNEADRLDLIRTADLRATLDAQPPRPGTGRLKAILDAQTFSRAQNALERRTDLGRDQAHARKGLRTLRFTHSQVFHRPDHVRAVLHDTFRHLD